MPRFRKRIPVYYATQEGMQHAGISVDLGPMGLFLVSREPCEPGEFLHLEVELPQLGVVELAARVVRKIEVPAALRSVRQNGFAVSVVNAPEEWFQFQKQLAAK